MRVLITGGAGYVGSHTTLALLAAGHEVVIADNFVNSHRAIVARLIRLSGRDIPCIEVDLTSEVATERVFETQSFDAVIHCAGLKSVGESVLAPIEYYRNNLGSALSVVAAMQKHGVSRLVFSSSATVYGHGATPPFAEGHHRLESTNPYGQSKVMIERILADVALSSAGWKIALLRYFNPVGAHRSGMIGEDPQGIPNNLMPYVAQVAVGRLPHLTVHGNDYETADGTGERDYIHIMDLAAGHVAALESLERMAYPVRAFNLGTGKPTSVLDLVHAFERASGRQIPLLFGPRRPGDLAIAYADSTRANVELGWRAIRSVDEMCADTWRWQSTNPIGIADAMPSSD